MITNSRGVLQIPCTETKHPPLKPNKNNNKIYKAIGLTSSIWKQGGTGNINVTFGSYNYPNEANVSPFAAWSYVGSQTNGQMPSMNLGFIDPPLESFEYDGKIYKPESYATRNYCGINGNCVPNWVPGATVVHEFCHALGMLHEHQNNLNNMNTLKTSLNTNSVINYYRSLDPRDPNPEETAKSNVLDYYENKDIQDTTYVGSNYDPTSIMHYALPDSWFNNYRSPGFVNPTNPIFVLSRDDIEWLKQRYPLGDPSKYPTLTIKFIDKFDSGAIAAFKDDITSKYDENCSNNNSEVCKEIRNVYNNLNKFATDKSRWETEQAWKKAWIQKTVLDTFTPLIGVKFVFKDQDGKILKNVVSNDYTQPAPSPIENTGIATNSESVSDNNSVTNTSHNESTTNESNKSLEIVSGVFGTIIGIGLIIGIAALLYKSFGNRHHADGIYFTYK